MGPFPVQRVAFEPRAMVDVGFRVPDAPAIRFAAPGVEMAVEDQAISIAAPRQRAKHIEAFGKHSDLLRRKSFAPHPVKYKFAHVSFTTGGAFDVTEIEREPDKLITIDRGIDSVEICLRHRLSPCTNIRHNVLIRLTRCPR